MTNQFISYRTCTNCRKYKPLTEYANGNGGGYPHYRKVCRDCYNRKRRNTYTPDRVDCPDNRAAGYWLVEHDPDADFTGRQFSASDMRPMIRLHSFSPGALLVDPDGRRFRMEEFRLAEITETVGIGIAPVPRHCWPVDRK